MSAPVVAEMGKRWRAYWAPLGFPWAGVIGSLALSGLMIWAVVVLVSAFQR
jgi:hypothetical protein